MKLNPRTATRKAIICLASMLAAVSNLVLAESAVDGPAAAADALHAAIAAGESEHIEEILDPQGLRDDSQQIYALREAVPGL